MEANLVRVNQVLAECFVETDQDYQTMPDADVQEALDTVGDKTSAGTWSGRWAPGKFCELITLPLVPSNQEPSLQMIGITGYDRVNIRSIEKDFWSDGSHYPISWGASSPIHNKADFNGKHRLQRGL